MSKKPNVVLGEWRSALGLSHAKAGALFGVSGVNFRAWEVGEKRPAAGPRREAIELRVGIPRDAWNTPKERKLLAAAREATCTPSVPPLPAPPTEPPPRKTTAPQPAATAKPATRKAAPPKRAALDRRTTVDEALPRTG